VNIPNFAGGGHLDFGEWIRGLVAGFVQGGAGAVTSGLTVSAMDPHDYNLGGGLRKLMGLMVAMFVVNGFLGAMSYLRNKPVPETVPDQEKP
jgi:hypothetical protein